MAKHWYIKTSATRDEVIAAANKIFFVPPSFKDRFKLSKAAQLQSNLRWERSGAEGADLAAIVVSGGLREAVSNTKRGPGSMLGTTVALAVSDEDDSRIVQLWLAEYNTHLWINQQADVLKSYAKQIAKELTSGGATSEVRKR